MLKHLNIIYYRYFHFYNKTISFNHECGHMSAKLLQNHPLHNNSMAARQCDQMLVYKLPNFSKFHKKVAKAVFTYKVRSTKSPNIWTIVARQFLAKNFPKSGHTAARFKENFPKQVRRRRYGGGRVQRSQRRSGST